MKFTDVLTENKKKKTFTWQCQWRKKRKTERKWKANEETDSSLRELKTGRLVLTDKI